jgi:probable F420-dependent oxidoreductase
VRPRLGVNPLVPDPGAWLDTVRRLEDAGVDEISVSDHLTEAGRPPLVSLAAAAVVTERVTLSTLVLNNELRHPGVLAQEAAHLAELSGGRLVLGVGAGHAESEHAAIGLPFPSVGARVRRLEAAVLALRALLDGEELTTEGPDYTFHEHRTFPVPGERVPVLVGGGSRAVLTVAARHADIVGFTGFSSIGGANRLTHFSAAGLDDRVRFVRDAAGDRADDLGFQALIQHLEVTDDRDAAAARLAVEWEEEGLDVAAVLDSPFLLLGTAAEIADQLRARTDRWGLGTWTTFLGRPTDPSVDDVAEVVAALSA